MVTSLSLLSSRRGLKTRRLSSLRTLTTLDRFGLVQWINHEPTLRMLQIPELKRAMGLIRLRDEHGKPIEFAMNHGTRKDKVKILGNGVCAPVMKAIVGSLAGADSRDVLPETDAREYICGLVCGYASL